MYSMTMHLRINFLVSAGLEYVAGLNTISVNVYRGLSEKKVGPYQFNTPLRQVPRAIDFHDSLSTPPDGIHSTPRYSYEHVLTALIYGIHVIIRMPVGYLVM